MPLIETKGAASAQGFGEFAKTGVATYIEDVFSTYLYTGNSTSGGTQTITNSIDLSTKGGMVWIKGRSAASNHILTDTTRGAGASATNNNALASNLTDAEDLGGSSYDFLSAFNTDGFTVKQGGTTAATRGTNYDAVTYASWTFRKQPKFFDVVTYTGNGSNRTIAHNLGSVPGCILVKRTDTTGAWAVYHRSLVNTEYLVLNTTAAKATGATYWNSTTPTSTEFSLGTATDVNANGGTYVAYLFAHDAGGFGLTGTDNVISCGSYTGGAFDGVNFAAVTTTLGFEPQWVLIKEATGSNGWFLFDNMRGISTGGQEPVLSPSSANSEFSSNWIGLTSTGFTATLSDGSSGINNGSSNKYIYIAIRRGPMKTPTTGTSVFSPNTYTGNSSTQNITTNFPVDLFINRNRFSAGLDTTVIDRLRGFGLSTRYLFTNSTAEEGAIPNAAVEMANTSLTLSSWGQINAINESYVNWSFRRAPGFFDVVCYTGTGSNTTQTHNLGVVPELIIVKRRDTTDAWDTYSAALSNTEYLVVDTTAAKATGTTRWNSTTPTSSVFSLGTSTTVNASGGTYVAYLFATVSGVSKVGSYTGTGALQTINCGFTGGARFVLIKRTDSTGDWYVWDSARGIVASTDPYLVLNSTSAEVTNTDWVDTYSAGFELSSAAGNNVNINAASYIFLSIA